MVAVGKFLSEEVKVEEHQTEHEVLITHSAESFCGTDCKRHRIECEMRRQGRE